MYHLWCASLLTKETGNKISARYVRRVPKVTGLLPQANSKLINVVLCHGEELDNISFPFQTYFKNFFILLNHLIKVDVKLFILGNHSEHSKLFN